MFAPETVAAQMSTRPRSLDSGRDRREDPVAHLPGPPSNRARRRSTYNRARSRKEQRRRAGLTLMCMPPNRSRSFRWSAFGIVGPFESRRPNLDQTSPSAQTAVAPTRARPVDTVASRRSRGGGHGWWRAALPARLARVASHCPAQFRACPRRIAKFLLPSSLP